MKKVLKATLLNQCAIFAQFILMSLNVFLSTCRKLSKKLIMKEGSKLRTRLKSLETHQLRVLS